MEKINFYNLDRCELFLDYKYRLISSKNYRRLDGKTQLFSSTKGDHFRNRLIHTEEVRQIGLRIASGINKLYGISIINFDLVECIAIAHDFGHTPFGHVGERTLQDIITKKDTLGDLLSKYHKQLYFKHNINSLRLLIEEFGDNIPWEILDGVLKHSRLKYNKDDENGIRYITNGIEYDKIFYKFKNSSNPLTLEGQIVSIADEIAQRYSDFEDTFRAKNINTLKQIIEKTGLKLEKCNEGYCVKYVDELSRNLIDSVVKQSVENINKLKVQNSDELIQSCEEKIIIEFDATGKKLNSSIENFVKRCIMDLDDLRSEDEKNKYVIRQLFKAFYNNCLQIRGNYFLLFAYKMNELRNKLDFNNDTKKRYKDMISIQFVTKSKIDVKLFNQFVNELKNVERDLNTTDNNLIRLYYEYLRGITFYIASMTDNYALECYKFLYSI